MREIENKIRSIFRHWKFGEIESNIMGVLLSSPRPLTAMEIANKIGYAYSTTVNSLNDLIRRGYVEKRRKERKYVYSADIDFVKIIEMEKKKLTHMLKELFEELRKMDAKERFGRLLEKIRIAMKYLEKEVA